MFVYRDEYYFPESPDKGVAEIIVAKQRNGPTGTVKTRFTPEYTRFDNLAEETYEFDEYDGFEDMSTG
jgi:replicative DNA helicase